MIVTRYLRCLQSAVLRYAVCPAAVFLAAAQPLLRISLSLVLASSWAELHLAQAQPPDSAIPPVSVPAYLAQIADSSAKEPDEEPAAVGGAQPARPTLGDPGLQLELMAEHPQLMTPVGIAIHPAGTVFVVESHTHFRPEDYDGPPGDRILIFDSQSKPLAADPQPAPPRVFYEGTRYTMQVAVHPLDPELLYVATRSQLFQLRDTDHDGRADQRVDLVTLETPGDYPHNGLSGLTFDAAGNVYLGMGENLGVDYRLIAADGTTITGGGEGGNVFRCRADGTQLVRFATGFWNPFALAFDPAGRLFAVDNDPDSRPPCRLLHVVDQGDYGFRFRNGRKGISPFTAWDGELPGTLGMVAGTGEAPSGLVYYRQGSLPKSLHHSLIGGSWGSHRIEQFQLAPHGATWRAERRTLVQGDEMFRPVGLAIAPDGTLWFTDWVDKSYPLHRQGRLWRLTATQDSSAVEDTTSQQLNQLNQFLSDGAWTDAENLVLQATPQPDLWHALLAHPDYQPQQLSWSQLPPLPEIRAAWMRRWASQTPPEEMAAALLSDDGFTRQGALVAAIAAIRQEELLVEQFQLQRHGAQLLLMRRAIDAEFPGAFTEAWLSSPDPEVRLVALQWIAEARYSPARPQVEQALREHCDSRELFAAALATLDRLDQPPGEAGEERDWQAYAAPLLGDHDLTTEVLTRVIRLVPAEHPAWTDEVLDRLLNHSSPTVQLETIRTWRLSEREDLQARLRTLVQDGTRQPQVRLEAVASLSPEDVDNAPLLRSLAVGTDPELAEEALRTLLSVPPTPDDMATWQEHASGASELWRAMLQARLNAPPSSANPDSPSTAPPSTDAPNTDTPNTDGPNTDAPNTDAPNTGTPNTDTPNTDGPNTVAAPTSTGPALADPALAELEARIERLSGSEEGDARLGERLFFHPRVANCARCHESAGRGAVVGPNLTGIGRTTDRRRLAESLLDPSREIAPQFIPWVVELVDGRVVTGVLVHQDDQNRLTFLDATGEQRTLSPTDISTRHQQRTSIMPSGLADQLTDFELASLFAYLRAANN